MSIVDRLVDGIAALLCAVVNVCFWASDHWKWISASAVGILAFLLMAFPGVMINAIPSFSFLAERRMGGAVRHVIRDALQHEAEGHALNRILEGVKPIIESPPKERN